MKEINSYFSVHGSTLKAYKKKEFEDFIKNNIVQRIIEYNSLIYTIQNLINSKISIIDYVIVKLKILYNPEINVVTKVECIGYFEPNETIINSFKRGYKLLIKNDTSTLFQK